MSSIKLLAILSACLVVAAAPTRPPGPVIKELPLDFTTRNFAMNEGEMAFGWRLMPWAEWLQRATSGPLMIEIEYNKNDIEVFEARAAGVVQRPIAAFTEKYLHDINTIKKLNPQNQHKLISAAPFTVETTIPFPPKWSDAIAVLKTASLLDDKTTDYLRATNVFGYADKKKIEASAHLSKVVKLLDIAGKDPDVINFQGSTKVNQIAKSISIVTLFYRLDANRTLVVCHMALTLKRHLLTKGIDSKGYKLNGRAVLMGENSVINTESGIGAGLPQYSREFFASMLKGL